MQVFQKQNREAYTNFLRAKYEAYTGATTVRSYPYYLLIDPADVCNLRCATCPTGMDNETRRTGSLKVLNRSQRTVMTPELFDAVIEELGPYLFFVMFYNWGEPLLNKHIHEFIRKAKSYDIVTAMHTNLSLKLSDQRIEDLLSSGLDSLVCSIDGFTQEVYEIHRVGGNMEQIKKNLEKMVQVRNRLGVKTEIVYKMLVFGHNEHEIPLAAKYCQDIGVAFVYEDAVIPDQSWITTERSKKLTARGEQNQASQPAGSSWSKFVKVPLVLALTGLLQVKQLLSRMGLFLNRDAEQKKLEVLYPDMKGESQFPKHCSWHYGYSVITAGGPVAPCCATAKEADDFGRITPLQTSFAEVWNNEKYRRARSTVAGQKLPGSAGARTICEPCRFPQLVQHVYSLHDPGILAAAHLKFNSQEPALAEAFRLLAAKRYGFIERSSLQLGIFEPESFATGTGDERDMADYVSYYKEHLIHEPTAIDPTAAGPDRRLPVMQ